MTKIKYKALFIIDSLEIGGTEKSLFEMAIRFNEIEPIVCHLYPGESLKSAFELHKIKVYSLNIKGNYGFYEAYCGVKEIIDFERPDLLVAYLTKSELVTRVIGKVYDIPVIGTFVSDLYNNRYNQSLNWKSRKAVSFFKTLNKVTAKLCSGFISNSNGIKVSNTRHLNIPEDKVKVIYRGRDSKIFKYSKGHTPDQPITKFLNIGRLFPVKGQKKLIMAFNEINQLYPNTTLDIIGDGPLKLELTNLVNDYGLQDKVILHGAKTEIHLLLKNYDCFVFPSLSEGFSGSVVEAMFSGLPVLASRIPANEEAIKHNITGFLFEANSVEAIIGAMKWFIHNREEALILAKKAHVVALNNFELGNVALETEKYLISKIRNS